MSQYHKNKSGQTVWWNTYDEIKAEQIKANALTLDDVTQALGIEEVLQTGHLIFQLTHQTVIRIFIDHSITTDLLSPVCIPESHTKWT